ncbi:plastocyanin/azurin family copper-binding protein [Haladaptatus sp. DFWS20]|uniref:plastocyanin/azurin family copper-binding protein n=1 Tax=Haladaptatus sp. DFWS20 TaxID=3403467 RepID=UPI003EBE8CC5
MTSQHDRRTMLKATGSMLAVGTFAGCLAGGQPGSDGKAKSDDETKANTTLKIGPGGNLTFVSDDVTIHPGQTVAWEWKSDNHNIVVENQPEGANWTGTPGAQTKLYNTGYRYTHTFETVGEYEYYCQPHEAAGMVGTVTVTPEGTSETTTETTNEAKPPATEDDLPIQVGTKGELVFTPGTERPLKVPAGTEVTFVWQSDTHNIAVESQPEGANWKGSLGDDGKTYDEGYEYSHTFDVPGRYEFYCVPHETVGEKGTIIVE